MDKDKEYREEIYGAMKEVLKVIERSHLVMPKGCKFEIYHHYGYNHFRKIGAVFIKVVNRLYCKSFAILLPGQSYPAHYHKIKIETFYVCYGDLTVIKENTEYSLLPGEALTVERLEEHSFYSNTGCVFEEISTTYTRNDSIYIDENIDKNYDTRKTVMTIEQWEELKSNVESKWL